MNLQITQQRDSWLFGYSASAVLSAARKKAKLHHARVRWWQAQQKKIVAECRKKGLDVEETIAHSYGNTSPLRGKQLVVNDRYQLKLNECHTKIDQHAEKARAYDGWVSVLTGRTEELSLTANDYLFFFGE